MGVGQKLPWGKDITIKTLSKHLPFVLQVRIISLDIAYLRLYHFITASLSYATCERCMSKLVIFWF